MEINNWLKKQMVSAEAYDADELLKSFLSEMEKGLNGEASSLAMIPAYVGDEKSVPSNTSVAVIDAGGTNLRICLARFDEQEVIHVSSFSKQSMPGLDRKQSAAEFYTVLVDALEPLKDQFEHLGFCFSYPALILPNYDGRLLHWTKEIKVPELVGKRMGKGLLHALEARGITGKKIVVLNDTVATLLAGLSEEHTFSASSHIGFILGTGTNTAYVEQNKNIGKLAGDRGPGAQIINVESGGFAAFQRGPFDRQVDAQSEDPGRHIFEKLISGAYMGLLTLEVLQALAEKEQFSNRGGAALLIMKTLSTIHINNLLVGKEEDLGVLGSVAFTDADREIMKMVFSGVIDRAAKLTAVNLSATVVKSGGGKEASRPVCINIDGSTYYKTYQFADRVQVYLEELLTTRGLHVRCVRVVDAPIVGAAIAGLTTF